MDESIDAQIRAIEEYADKNDIKIVNKFIDRAKSATSDKRPAFQEMIKYCEADNIICLSSGKMRSTLVFPAFPLN